MLQAKKQNFAGSSFVMRIFAAASFVMYYIIYGLLYAFSLLPFQILYRFSDVTYGVLYYLAKYRKDVVMGNLDIAFPEKTKAEKIEIAKGFYQRFADNFFECIKLLSISEKQLLKRFKVDYESFRNACKNNGKLQVHLAHYFNWEMANLAYCKESPYKFLLVYKPLASKAMERIFTKVRSRFGSILIRSDHYRQDFTPHARDNYVLILVADQNPSKTDDGVFTPFFGKPAPFVQGPDKGARFNQSAVLMCNFYRVKRGYYTSELHIVTDNARTLAEGEITRIMVTYIEESIRKHPSDYLWSHRRWRHTYEPEKHKLI